MRKYLLLLPLVFLSCSFQENDFLPTGQLHVAELGRYTIYLSDDYEIEVSDEIDFTVYYIVSNEESNYGGIYFGFFPSGFGYTGEKVVTIREKILGHTVGFDVYKTESKYQTEVIIDHDGWAIHLWANGETIEKVKEILYYYSTIEEK